MNQYLTKVKIVWNEKQSLNSVQRTADEQNNSLMESKKNQIIVMIIT